jgi:eukaryotic-like serine/threonine-protein kinase
MRNDEGKGASLFLFIIPHSSFIISFMDCPNCHRPLREGAQFCTRCGARTEGGSAQARADSQSESAPTAGRERAEASAATVVESDALVGRVLDGKYEVVAPLGEGGMGAVYLARRVLIGDEVAVKVLHAKFTGDQTLVERFRREARAAAQLHHPNVVTIHDYGEARGREGFAYIVMELVRGEPLRELLRREGRLDAARAVSLMRGVCAGVGAAHRRGIVHRDLKPDNIIVAPADEDSPAEHVKVVDFGIAKLRDMAAEGTLTHVGAVVGTPNYMSPEQCKGESLDARADVYSLGALLYEMLAGTPPFTAPSIPGVIIKHVTEPPPPLPRELHVPAALEEAIARALSKDPEARQRDASEFARDLQAALSTPTAEPSRREEKGGQPTDEPGRQPAEPFFPATPRPEPVRPAPATPTQATPPPSTPTQVTPAPPASTSSAPQTTAVNADTSGNAAGTNPAAQTRPQAFPQHTYAQEAPPPQTYNAPQQARNVPRRKSRAPLVVGLLVLMLVGLGILGVAGLVYLGNRGGGGTAANVNARPTPAQANSNRGASNANAAAANANASVGNANAALTFDDADAVQRAERKIVAGSLLTKEDLSGLSAAQMRLLRNAVYARYGRTFESPDLQSYFQSRPWYHPRTDYSDRLLTANDRANADLIKSFEEGGTPAATPSDPATAKKEVAAALEGWASSLRERDVDTHMSYYADALDTYYNKQNVPASQVRSDRARAFSLYDSMDVKLSDVEITPDPTGARAVVTFDKTWDFESDSRHATGSVRQQLTLANTGGRWLITGEKDLKVYYTNNEEY